MTTQPNHNCGAADAVADPRPLGMMTRLRRACADFGLPATALVVPHGRGRESTGDSDSEALSFHADGDYRLAEVGPPPRGVAHEPVLPCDLEVGIAYLGDQYRVTLETLLALGDTPAQAVCRLWAVLVAARNGYGVIEPCISRIGRRSDFVAMELHGNGGGMTVISLERAMPEGQPGILAVTVPSVVPFC